MKIVLAAVTCKNGDVSANERTIEDNLRKYQGQADLIVFGETFLHGFNAFNWNSITDENIANSIDDPVIRRIRECAAENHTGVSFGYLEKDGNTFFSSQLTIGNDGSILNNFRRVSPGWKETAADDHYQEGNTFPVFAYQNKRIAVGLCGDLWFDENIRKVADLKPDIVLWPVYTEFPVDQWNESEKYAYCEQANKFCADTVYVNSYCVDGQNEAGGGAAYFHVGKLEEELPAGGPGELLVEISSSDSHVPCRND